MRCLIQMLRRRCLRRATDERGFTMVVTMGVLMVSSLLLVAAFTATDGDTSVVRNDLDQKKAYYAAQAAISNYAFHLNQDVSYWKYCYTSATQGGRSPAPGGPSAPANRVQVPGSADESYSWVPLAASTAPAPPTCDPLNPVPTMLESGQAANGTFRIQATGYSRNVSRTIVSTFRRKGFLNYVYYTQYETLDPATYYPANPPDCAHPYGQRPQSCGSINFTTGDAINGPMHSEDSLSICGNPTFGRNSRDAIETVPTPGHYAGPGGCSDYFLAGVRGTFKAPANSVIPPPNNGELLATAQSGGWTFTGTTHIVLNGATMTVTKSDGTTQTGWPTNGVIYVSSDPQRPCPAAYTPYNVDYTANPGCGNVFISGNYTTPLTVASDNDVIIRGDLTTTVDGSGRPTTNALLGLVSNNFVRVYHPVSARGAPSAFQCGSAQNTDTSPNTIYAAILAVKHSFIVDNYDCGAALGTLNVYGAIAQIFRGTVGTSGAGTGYLKNYGYDDRLASEEPPFFLNPVQAAWLVGRETECGQGSSGPTACS